MDERGIPPEKTPEGMAALSEARQQYCQLLVNSLTSPHLDTSKPEINAHLLRAVGEVLTNGENRVKVILDRSMQSGEATAAEQEKCVAEFQKRLHYMEEYLSTCFQTRNVNHLYGEMEVEEPATSGPQYRAAQRAMAKIRRQLQEDLDVQNSMLLDGLVQHKLVRDWERDSILARATPRAKAEELLRTVTPRLDQIRLQQQFLPLLREDHEHLAEALSRALEEEKEVGGSEAKCCVCQFHEVVEVKRLARHLNKVVSPSLDSDLSNPALTNTSKMHRLKEEVSLEQVIGSLREPYPALHQQFCSESVTALECFCARLREAQTSDSVDGLGSHSMTDDDDVARLSDLQSMLGDADSRLPENPSKMNLPSRNTHCFGLKIRVVKDHGAPGTSIFWPICLLMPFLAAGLMVQTLAAGVVVATNEEPPHGVRNLGTPEIWSHPDFVVLGLCSVLVLSNLAFAVTELSVRLGSGRRFRGSSVIIAWN